MIVKRKPVFQNLNWKKSCRQQKVGSEDLLRAKLKDNHDLEIISPKGEVIRQQNTISVWVKERFDIIQE